MFDVALLELLPVTTADLRLLYDIHRKAMRPVVEATWGWDEEQQSHYFRECFDVTCRQRICYGGIDIGYWDVLDHSDVLELRNVVIHPDYQAQGLGSHLIRQLIARAESKSVPIILQVLRVNQRARSLYERFAFAVVGETATHFLMERPSRRGR